MVCLCRIERIENPRVTSLNRVSISDTVTQMTLIDHVSVKCLIQKIFIGFLTIRLKKLKHTCVQKSSIYIILNYIIYKFVSLCFTFWRLYVSLYPCSRINIRVSVIAT